MKTYFLILFLLLFAGILRAENPPYKINDAAIDLLFEKSEEIISVNYLTYSEFGRNFLSKDESDTRIISGILGIVLGGLGVHRFYLGHKRAAIIGYCIPSLCAGLGYIPGIIDGILYLVATDEEFNQKYRDNQKIWVWL